MIEDLDKAAEEHMRSIKNEDEAPREPQYRTVGVAHIAL